MLLHSRRAAWNAGAGQCGEVAVTSQADQFGVVHCTLVLSPVAECRHTHPGSRPEHHRACRPRIPATQPKPAALGVAHEPGVRHGGMGSSGGGV